MITQIVRDHRRFAINPNSTAGRVDRHRSIVPDPYRRQHGGAVLTRRFRSYRDADPPAVTQLPGLYITTAANNKPPWCRTRSRLDGRWLHAFNGPGPGRTSPVTGLPASYYPELPVHRA